MPHQNVEAGKATAQNAATDPVGPGDQTGRDQGRDGAEPRSYAAADAADSTLAPPAAGEMADFADEGEDLGGAEFHTGRDRTNVAAHSRSDTPGEKTHQANQERIKGRDPG